jgi:hypothetical protein
MFDSNTVALIKSAPPLPGLDLNALPQQITEAYAAIVSARIRLRTVGESDASLGIAAAVFSWLQIRSQMLRKRPIQSASLGAKIRLKQHF